MNRRLPTPRPCNNPRLVWLLKRIVSLPGPPGSGFCPSAVISVISSHVEGLLEMKKNVSLKAASLPANLKTVLVLIFLVAIYLGIT